MSRAAVAPVEAPQPWQAWAEEEFSDAELGDRRRSRRLVAIAAAFMESPEASIPKACRTWAPTKAAYRFFRNKNVDSEAIVAAHRRRAVERAKSESVVLAIGDTTELDYSHPETEGLGPLNDIYHLGLLLQPTFLVTPDRVPLGIIHQRIWTREEETLGKRRKNGSRKIPIELKESFKWMESFEAGERLAAELEGSGTKVISVFDREGDVFDVVERATRPGTKCGLLVRASRDRNVLNNEHHLWASVAAQPPRVLTIKVPRKGKQKEREAELSVRFSPVAICPPRHRATKEGLLPALLFAVHAHEEHPPKRVEPVSWMLITTVAVQSFDDACRMVAYYACRWGIELFFKVLKSGCKTEQRQLEDADALIKCLTLDSIVAWRISYLTTVGRRTPDVPCTCVFEDHEWQALWAYVHHTPKVPKEVPTLQQVVRMVASLGGFLGRKSDGQPGRKTLWLGLQALHFLAGMWQITRAG